MFDCSKRFISKSSDMRNFRCVPLKISTNGIFCYFRDLRIVLPVDHLRKVMSSKTKLVGCLYRLLVLGFGIIRSSVPLHRYQGFGYHEIQFSWSFLLPDYLINSDDICQFISILFDLDVINQIFLAVALTLWASSPDESKPFSEELMELWNNPCA